MNEIKSSMPKNVGNQWKLVFFFDGQQLSPHLPVIQAIHPQIELEEDDDNVSLRKSKVYTYQRAANITCSSGADVSSNLALSSTSLLIARVRANIHVTLRNLTAHTTSKHCCEFWRDKPAAMQSESIDTLQEG